MPIRFRCSYCNRLLGIATRKAGTDTTCPHCGYTITVPVPEPQDDGRTERISLEDVEQMLGQGGTEVLRPPAAVAAPPEAPKPPTPVYPKPTAPPPIPKAAPKRAPTANPNDPPLFEGDMDELLGKTAVPAEPERPKPAKVSGLDAMSLGEPPRQIVLSPQKATFLMVLVAVLMVVAFAAGYLIAPRG